MLRFNLTNGQLLEKLAFANYSLGNDDEAPKETQFCFEPTEHHFPSDLMSTC